MSMVPSAASVSLMNLPSGPWDPYIDLFLLPLLLPALLALLPLLAVNAKRWFALGTGGPAKLPGLLQLRREGPPMPGIVYAKKNRLWWVAEGCRRPIRIIGRRTQSPGLAPAPVPWELTLGVMDSPTSIPVELAGGPGGLLFVREPSEEAVVDILKKKKAKGRPPNAYGRSPIGRLGFVALGALVLTLGLAYGFLWWLGPRLAATVTTAGVGGDSCAYSSCQQVVLTDALGVQRTSTVYPTGLGEGDSLEVIVTPVTHEVVEPEVLGASAVLGLLVGIGCLGYGIGMLHRRRRTWSGWDVGNWAQSWLPPTVPPAVQRAAHKGRDRQRIGALGAES